MNPERIAAISRPCIGVFDSGVGGLSVLRALRRAMPAAPLVYYADSAFAPYGERDAAYVDARCRAIASTLVERGAKALLIACNTATAAAIEGLRDAWPGLPIIGVEPGVKPAVALSRSRRVAVMATQRTLQSERFRRLVERYAAECEVIAHPCPGLAAAIEAGDVEAPSMRGRVRELCEPLRGRGVDVIVLGCTHYPFVRHHIEAAMAGAAAIVDTAEAVARQTAARCEGSSWSGPATTRLMGSGDLDLLGRLATRWLEFDWTIESQPAADPISRW